MPNAVPAAMTALSVAWLCKEMYAGIVRTTTATWLRMPRTAATCWRDIRRARAAWRRSGGAIAVMVRAWPGCNEIVIGIAPDVPLT